MMSRLFKALPRLAARLLAVLCIAAALGSIGLRLALPQVAGLREAVTARLAEVLGVDVRMGSLSARLSGLTPVLTLTDAQLLDPANGEPLLALKALRLTLDPLASLRARQPRIDGITLVGAELVLERAADGRFGLRGLDALDGGDGSALEFFLREGRFSLADTTLYVADSTGGLPPLGLVVSRLDFTNRGERHWLRLHGRLAGDQHGELSLLARMHGPGQSFALWSGAAYLDWDGDPRRALHGWLPAGLAVGADAARLQVWYQFEGGQPRLGYAELGVRGLHVERLGPDREPLAEMRLPRVSALARLRAEPTGWRIDIADLLPGEGAGPVSGTDVRIRIGRAGDPGWTVQVGALGLGAPARLAGVLAPALGLPLPGPLPGLLAGPVQGRLDGLLLNVPPPAADGRPRDWRLRLGITGLGLPASPPVPALAHVALHIDTGPRAGSGRFTASGFDLDPRPWLPRPLPVQRLGGDVHWQRGPDGTLGIETRALVAETPALKSITRAKLLLRPDAKPFVDLHTHAWDGDVAQAGAFLPVRVMAPQLVDWLTRALVAGRLVSGDVLLRGDLGDFPFDDGSGRFLIDLRAADGILDYAPARDPASLGIADPARARANALGWPRLTGVATTVRIDGRRLDIEVGAGRILDSSIEAGSATLPDLWHPQTLAIEARGRGPLTDGQRILTETPVSWQLGGVARALAVTGDTALVLRLAVPLKRTLPWDFGGELTPTAGVTLQPVGTGFRFTDLGGTLRFDPKGVSGDGLTANLDGQPLRVAVTSPPAATEITLTGTTPVADLARRWPNPLWMAAGGSADWRLLLRLDHAALREGPAAVTAPLLFTLTSELAGVTLSPPPPIGKTAAETRPLRAVLPWTGRWPLNAELRVGDLGARIEIGRAAAGTPGAPGAHLTRLAIDPGALPAALPAQPGIAIDGTLGPVDLVPWIAWFTSPQSPFSGEAARVPAPQQLPLLPIGLRAPTVGLGVLRWQDVDARIAPERDGGFLITFQATGGGGQVRLPAQVGDAPVTVQLQSLDAAPLLTPTPPSAEPSPSPATDPRRGPALALTVDNVRVGERPIGRLRGTTTTRADGLYLTDFSLAGPLIDAQGNGAWTIDPTGFRATRITLTARSSDIGELLRTGGHYSELAGAPGQAQIQLAWPGDPWAFALQRARGSIALDVGAGRLLAVEPGVGRMLGVLNLGALRRRLSLDFSDLFDTGFAFDSLRGTINVGGGQARIAELNLLASAADIAITGTADLNAGTLDQTVRVTPKLGTGVAIAGTVAGGPLVGAAAWLVDKAAGGAVDRLARVEYRVTGPWRTPEVRQVDGILPTPSPATTGTPPARPAPATTNPFLDGG